MLTKGKSRLTMKTLAPNPARITKRGGQGHDFWGNPYNPQAQYNHTLDNKGQQSDAYLKPTLSPWRLEVEPTTSEARDYFLHVLFVTDEGARQPDAGAKEVPQAERVEEGDRVGARLRLGDREVTVLFNRTGDLGGHLNVTEAGKTLHDAELAQSVPKD
jgi:hypothetical protein